MKRLAVGVAIVLGLSTITACDPTQVPSWWSKCPTVDIADRTGSDYAAERDYLGRWETDGIIRGFSAQEDGLIYQTRWCADHMPQY